VLGFVGDPVVQVTAPSQARRNLHGEQSKTPEMDDSPESMSEAPARFPPSVTVALLKDAAARAAYVRSEIAALKVIRPHRTMRLSDLPRPNIGTRIFSSAN
jgi:hypothetical protein